MRVLAAVLSCLYCCVTVSALSLSLPCAADSRSPVGAPGRGGNNGRLLCARPRSSSSRSNARAVHVTHAFRGEEEASAAGVGKSALFFLSSAPALWARWLQQLRSSHSSSPLAKYLLIARGWLSRRRLALATAVIALRIALGEVSPALAATANPSAPWEADAPPTLTIVDCLGYAKDGNERIAKVKGMLNNPYSNVKDRAVPGSEKMLNPNKLFNSDFQPSYEAKVMMEKRYMDHHLGMDVYKGANPDLLGDQKKEMKDLIRTLAFSVGGVATVMIVFKFFSGLALDEEKELYGREVRVDAVEKPEEDEDEEGDEGLSNEGNGTSSGDDSFPPSTTDDKPPPSSGGDDLLDDF